MKLKLLAIAIGFYALTASSSLGRAQQAPAVPQADSSTIDSNGIAHITRVVPLPQTVSPQARKSLAKPIVDPPSGETLRQSAFAPMLIITAILLPTLRSIR
jgi:hypothetical protein